MFEGKKWAVLKTPGWLFYYTGLLYRTSHLYGEFFFSQDKDPYDKPSKAKVATEHLENAFVKGAVSNEAPGTSTVRGSCREAETPRLPEDYEKACTQLLAQFKTLKTFGQTEFDGRLEKTDHVESDVEREHLYDFRHQM